MVNNANEPLFELRGQTFNKWGLDQTGLVSYRLNSQGFRSSRDYNWTPEYAFFGCSTVFGIGVDEDKTSVSYFPNSQNYGVAGNYLNRDSIINLTNFLNSPIYSSKVKIIFFWVDRTEQEDIPALIHETDNLIPNILHISQGSKHSKSINLMMHIDRDVSNTHPGPKTHKLWAKTLRLLIK